ncbi:hypothetical protein GGU11DRAFT_809387 [Lentinula aff. detonsa]|nr:hypothetical protein GGU11DRAFT_809387 [Lentinula aff. detonsa]
MSSSPPPSIDAPLSLSQSQVLPMWRTLLVHVNRGTRSIKRDSQQQHRLITTNPTNGLPGISYARGTNAGHTESPSPTSHLRPRSLSQSSINSFAPSLASLAHSAWVFFSECEDDEGGEGGGKRGEESEGEEEESRFEGGRPFDGEENVNVNTPEPKPNNPSPTNHNILYPGSLGPIFPSSHQIRILAFTHSSRPSQFPIRTCSLGVSLCVHSDWYGNAYRLTTRSYLTCSALVHFLVQSYPYKQDSTALFIILFPLSLIDARVGSPLRVFPSLPNSSLVDELLACAFLLFPFVMDEAYIDDDELVNLGFLCPNVAPGINRLVKEVKAYPAHLGISGSGSGSPQDAARVPASPISPISPNVSEAKTLYSELSIGSDALIVVARDLIPQYEENFYCHGVSGNPPQLM